MFDQEFQQELAKARRDMRRRFGAAVHELGGVSVDRRQLVTVIFEGAVSEWNSENLCADDSSDETLFILGTDYIVAGEESMSPLGDRVFMRNILARLRSSDYNGKLAVVDCGARAVRDAQEDGPDADGTMEYTGPPLAPNETWMDNNGFMWIGDENGNPVNMGQGQ